MDRPPFIISLHRPFHQYLKATRWVCEFLKENKVKSSEINVEFYFHLIKKLSKGYEEKAIKNSSGLPSENSIFEVNKYLQDKNKLESIICLSEILKSEDRNASQKHIYSTYKAASYYVNMAKDKLNLINKINELTESGINLLNIKTYEFRMNKEEKKFFFIKLLRVDFLMLITLCLFKKLGKKYKIQDFEDFQFEFLDEYYDIRHFNFISRSLNNYNTVRNSWIVNLGILDKNCVIKKTFLSIIKNETIFYEWYEKIDMDIISFEEKKLKKRIIYYKNKNKLEKEYVNKVNQGKGDLGFVDLYEIKSVMNMSFINFENFINSYYELEKGRKYIYFSNTVNSIDRRKRFSVRNIPVLKIKLK